MNGSAKTRLNAYVPLAMTLEHAPEAGALDDRWRVWFKDLQLGYLHHHNPLDGDGHYYFSGAKELYAVRSDALAHMMPARQRHLESENARLKRENAEIERLRAENKSLKANEDVVDAVASTGESMQERSRVAEEELHGVADGIEAHLIGGHWSVFVHGVCAGRIDEVNNGIFRAIGIGDRAFAPTQSFTAAARHLAREHTITFQSMEPNDPPAV